MTDRQAKHITLNRTWFLTVVTQRGDRFLYKVKGQVTRRWSRRRRRWLPQRYSAAEILDAHEANGSNCSRREAGIFKGLVDDEWYD